MAGIADIWKIHSFSTVAPRTPVSINHLSKMHKDPLNPLKWHTKISSFLQSHMCFRYRRRIVEALHRSCCEVDRVDGTVCVTALPASFFLIISMLLRRSLCSRTACIPQDAHLIPRGLIPHGAHASYETMDPTWNSRTRATYQAPHMGPDMGSQTRC